MLRRFIHILRKFVFLKFITDVLLKFIFEFLGNDIIAHIPIEFIRRKFYICVLGIRMNDSVYVLKGCYFYPYLGDLYIGENTIINNDCILDRRSNLYIGSNVNISREVAIYTGGHDIDSRSFAYKGNPVTIGDYVWLGTRAMVMPGVNIGTGAVILPGAIVTHDCEPYTVYGGIPAKKIRVRNDNLDYKLTWRDYFF